MGETLVTLQDAILRLSRFWADEGCLLLTPCDFRINAGTLHPDVFSALLGPEPCRLAYLQPVRRPLDGRLGRHPYRLAKHLQFQVVIQDPADDLRDVYLRSLQDLGLELGVHDLRFVEWSWEAPALGGTGRGWHVLLDGLGVSRVTYLLELAGAALEPVGLEISYGLERLLMCLAGARSAYLLPWAENGPEYGRLRRAEEIEMSRWATELADPEVLGQQLALAESEAQRCLDAGLPRAADGIASHRWP